MICNSLRTERTNEGLLLVALLFFFVAAVVSIVACCSVPFYASGGRFGVTGRGQKLDSKCVVDQLQGTAVPSMTRTTMDLHAVAVAAIKRYFGERPSVAEKKGVRFSTVVRVPPRFDLTV